MCIGMFHFSGRARFLTVTSKDGDMRGPKGDAEHHSFGTQPRTQRTVPGTVCRTHAKHG